MQVIVQPHAPAVLLTGKPAWYSCHLYITQDCHTETRICNLQALQEGKYLNPDLSVKTLFYISLNIICFRLRGFYLKSLTLFASYS